MVPTETSSTFITEIMNWHFSEATGCQFWLDRRRRLDFDPLVDIRDHDDLSRFPDIADELRGVPVEALVPRGLAEAPVAGVFESGGTTGAPKRVVVFEAWLDQLVNWRLDGAAAPASDQPHNTLAMVPTGPHVVGAINRLRARRCGGQFFTVDLDPRWVKKLVGLGRFDLVEQYSEHLLDQAEEVLTSQRIHNLIATPPLLERLARRRHLLGRLNATLERITWGGTQMDPDTLAFLRGSVFPDVQIVASYGSTMILGEAKSRDGEEYDGSPIFDTYAPYITFEVVDHQTRQPVAYGQRGRVVMHHVSQYALIPNVLERDTAIRLPAPAGNPGVSVAAVGPVAEVGGRPVIEGVY